jgi:hypothetical protein
MALQVSIRRLAAERHQPQLDESADEHQPDVQRLERVLVRQQTQLDQLRVRKEVEPHQVRPRLLDRAVDAAERLPRRAREELPGRVSDDLVQIDPHVQRPRAHPLEGCLHRTRPLVRT